MIKASPDIMAQYGDSIAWQNDHILPHWVLDHMDITITHLDAQSATFQLAHNDSLFRRFPPPRDEKFLCGQAVVALADTLLVFPVIVANGHEKSMVTLDLSTQFLKPVLPGNIGIKARIIQNGNRAIRGVVDVFDQQQRLCATTMVCYMVI